MAQFMKLLGIFALTTAIIITTTTTTFALEHPFKDPTPAGTVKIRPSRFLELDQGPKARNPNANDHCNPEICSSSETNSTMACCNNTCMDISTDHNNCGACKNKCKFVETCCGGTCVDTNEDTRHCGECNLRCRSGLVCYYGRCNREPYRKYLE